MNKYIFILLLLVPIVAKSNTEALCNELYSKLISSTQYKIVKTVDSFKKKDCLNIIKLRKSDMFYSILPVIENDIKNRNLTYISFLPYLTKYSDGEALTRILQIIENIIFIDVSVFEEFIKSNPKFKDDIEKVIGMNSIDLIENNLCGYYDKQFKILKEHNYKYSEIKEKVFKAITNEREELYECKNI